MAHQLKKYFKKFKTNQAGQIQLTGVLNVEEYQKINVCIKREPQGPHNMTVECYMGKLSGTTLGRIVGKFALKDTAHIHTFDVIGPEFSIFIIGGKHHTNVNIQAWVFLH